LADHKVAKETLVARSFLKAVLVIVAAEAAAEMADVAAEMAVEAVETAMVVVTVESQNSRVLSQKINHSNLILKQVKNTLKYACW
jgi:hypothetical protein